MTVPCDIVDAFVMKYLCSMGSYEAAEMVWEVLPLTARKKKLPEGLRQFCLLDIVTQFIRINDLRLALRDFRHNKLPSPDFSRLWLLSQICVLLTFGQTKMH
ncbi:unnamed protein product [Notodromas monacha]|uniref:Uncharacterized protein n=1 Tax=Notodromas monacha TaxID=399045 RepID=A0A7R9BTV7_9CRUS|nr:unnamed protein product [Notodromas monacha]CAG0921654.1 unnamed protein product [Notodromas monacha]